MTDCAPPIPCLYCRRPMKGIVLKLWGKFYYTCENPDCPMGSVDIHMKTEKTPAGKFFQKVSVTTTASNPTEGE